MEIIFWVYDERRFRGTVHLMPGGLGGRYSRAVAQLTTEKSVSILAVVLAILQIERATWAGFGAALLVGAAALFVRGSRADWAACGICAGALAIADLAGQTVGYHGIAARGGRLAFTVIVGELLVAAVAYHQVYRPTTRSSMRVLALLSTMLLGLPAISVAVAPSSPTHCVIPNKNVTLYAEELGVGQDGKPRLGYGRSPSTATTPGPLIELMEGDCVAVTLVNHVTAATLQRIRDDGRWPSDKSLPLGLSLHPHGVRYTQLSDGTLHTGSYARPGEARTYLWYAAPRVVGAGRVVSPGSAGYWWYHDHVAGTDHGTGGINAGLWGGLIVRRPTDALPDHTYVVGMGGPGSLINFRRYPDSFACDRTNNAPGPDCFVATEGERVEFLVIGVPGPLASEDMHEFHLHGHTWADNRTGLLNSVDDDVRVIDAKSVGPSESWGFQVNAGDEVGPGDWMLHCHIQEHSDRGMLTFFRVLSPVGDAIPSPGALPHLDGAP